VVHISPFGICEDVRRFAQHSHKAAINSHNSQLTRRTDSPAPDSGAVRREKRTILGAKSKLLYSTMKLLYFGIGHMYIYNFFFA
jgi:hypothetical protein